MILTLDGSTILALTRSSTHAGSFLTGLQRSNCIVWHNVKSDINVECNNTPANWSNNLFLWSREHLRSNYLVIVHFIQAQFIKWKANAYHWHALYTVCPSTFFLSWTALKQSQCCWWGMQFRCTWRWAAVWHSDLKQNLKVFFFMHAGEMIQNRTVIDFTKFTLKTFLNVFFAFQS